MNAITTRPLPTVAELRNGYLRSSSADSAAALHALLGEEPDNIDAHVLRIARHVVAKDLQSFPALAHDDPGPDAVYWPNFRWLAEESRGWTLRRVSPGGRPNGVAR